MKKSYKVFFMIIKFKNFLLEGVKNSFTREIKKKLFDPNYFMTDYEVVRSMTNQMPDELMEFIFNWGKRKKSPWTQSWYNAEKDWGPYIDGKLRVADHWNFYAKNNTC